MQERVLTFSRLSVEEAITIIPYPVTKDYHMYMVCIIVMRRVTFLKLCYYSWLVGYENKLLNSMLAPAILIYKLTENLGRDFVNFVS